ncbi:MAG: sodium:calcium antiporter, partial [Pseudomonadota bacterium]
LVLLVIGARTFVGAAIELARAFGVSELVIGLTIVAAGTSMPEVATSIMAAVRGQRDIAVGNVVGSNTFNILGVLGLTAVVAPTSLPVAGSLQTFDLPVMTAVAVACLPIFFTGHTIARWEGAVFVGYYVAYVAYLVLNAQQHDALDDYSLAMRWVVLPLTLLTLAVIVVREFRRRR